MKILRGNLTKPFSAWLALAACAALLAACGGGGGNPGAVPGTTPPGAVSKVASVALIASAPTLLFSGADGTEVTLTAVAKDAGNIALAGETVVLAASSGTISSASLVTDASGTVTAKLDTKGNPALRDITITASVGAVKSSELVIKVVSAASSVASVQLTSSNGTLASGGTAEVTVVAQVKDGNNALVANTTVNFSADSGALSQTAVLTNAKGQASVTLNTIGDPSLRTVTVTADASGTKATTQVGVVGTRLTVSSTSTINRNASTDMTVKLVDSAGVALTGKAVSFSSLVAANTLLVKDGGAAVTNASGELVLTYTALGGTSDTVTVKALGASATVGMIINTSNFTVAAVSAGGAALANAAINVCHKVAVHNDMGGVLATGAVTVNTSRGTMYSDSACGTPSTAFSFSAGNATAYISATGPGVATLTATAGTTSVQGMVEFVAPLTALATISVQADPAVVGANAAGSSVQQSVLRAVVLDGTAQNNLVKNASVSFSIVSDPSGGSLISPNVVLTGSDGAATVTYVAGTTATPINGVVVKAQIQGASSNSNTVRLTVAQRALFISAGTGNTVATPDATSYRKDYQVFVTDAAGNPVADVNITGSVRPRNYYKGFMQFAGTDGPWLPVYRATCLNEDTDSTGVWTLLKDTNGNGRLDPGIPLNLTPSGKTNASGTATVSLTYPRDRAYWLDVDFTIRGQVSGTESTYVGYTLLPGLSTDYATKTISPPGAVSPYGQASFCNLQN